MKQFARLMLDISDMTEKDKIFSFVEGLKSWVRTKLYEQRVQDLTSAYAAFECLFDLCSDSQDSMRHQSSSPRRNRNNRPNFPTVVSEDRSPGRDRKPFQSNTGVTWRRRDSSRTSNRPFNCYICDGSHQAKECSNRTTFYAFQASLTSDSDDKSSQPEKEVGQVEEVKNIRVGAIRFVSSLHMKVRETSRLMKWSLIYVDSWMNRKHAKSTMVDSGATQNFIMVAEARRLNLH